MENQWRKSRQESNRNIRIKQRHKGTKRVVPRNVILFQRIIGWCSHCGWMVFADDAFTRIMRHRDYTGSKNGYHVTNQIKMDSLKYKSRISIIKSLKKKPRITIHQRYIFDLYPNVILSSVLKLNKALALHKNTDFVEKI